MTYIVDGVQLGGDNKTTDAFSRLRTSSPTNLWTSEFQYNLHPLYFDEITASGGTVTHLSNESAASLAVNTTSGSKASLQTFEYFRYQPGKSHVCVLTFVASSQQANLKQCAGLFDDDNGFFFELSGASDAFVVVRSKVTGSVVDTKVEQANWNVDKMDGSGPSGQTMDFTKGQIFWIDLQWLSMGRIRFAFDLDGVLCYVHEHILNANKLTVASSSTANLPVKWEIINDGITAVDAKTLKIICASVFSEGGEDFETGHTFTGGNGAVLRTGIGTTPVPICSIRPATTINSITNRFKWVLESIDIIATNNMYWQLIYLPTSITGATFAVGPVAHSGVEVDIAGTAIVGGVVAYSGWIVANNQGGAAGTDLRTKFPFTLDAAGTDQSRSWTIAVRTDAGTNKTAAAQFNWAEIR